MPSWLVEEIVVFLVIGAVAVAIIWQIGANRRAKAALTHGSDYDTITRRAVESQEAIERRLSDVAGQLTDMSTRVGNLERILETAD